MSGDLRVCFVGTPSAHNRRIEDLDRRFDWACAECGALYAPKSSGPTPAQLALFDDLFGMYHNKVIARFEELLGGGQAEELHAATA